VSTPRVHPIRVPALLAALFLASCEAIIKEESREERAREEDAYSIGVQAYIYGLAPVEAYRTRHEWTQDPSSPLHAPVNRFRHERDLPAPGTAANADDGVLRSHAWLDLAREPIVLHVPPAKGRWYVFQLMDFWTNVFGYAGPGFTRSQTVDCALVAPGWQGELPAGLVKVQCPSPAVWISALTAVAGPADLAAARGLQDRYALTPLGLWRQAGQGRAKLDPSSQPSSPAYPPVPFAEKPPAAVKNDLRFFEVLNSFLRETPVPKRDAVLMKLFARIGLGPDGGFDAASLDPKTAEGLRRAMTAGELIVEQRSRSLSVPSSNGWVMTAPGVGAYGDDFLLRAACARVALGAPDDRLYMAASLSVDADGEPLHGRNRYELRFEKDGLPPVVFFWTIAIDSVPESRFVENAIGRYSIGSRTRGLRRGEDGSLTIRIQHERPGRGEESNWLPAPPGPFRLAPRFYGPKAALRDRTYAMPAVHRLDA
jgi:hypothetical protein